MIIRPERPEDAFGIESVTQRAFIDVPHSAGREAHIIRALRNAGALTVSLIAEAEGAIIGHVAASPITVSCGALGWYGLGPIAVDPARQGQGIGTALMHACLERLTGLGAAGCVVLGDPRYYARFGFAVLPRLFYPGVPTECFMALPFGKGLIEGEVSYHPAFE